MSFLSISPRLLLPLIILMGMLIIGMRLDDIWSAAAEGHLFSPKALAETKAGAPPADAKPQAAAAPAPPAGGDAKMPDAKSPIEGISEPSAAPPEEDVSPAEVEVLKQLSGRREALDRRAHDLDTREALIKVAEQRVDQKIKEMESLRQQLQSMVNQVSETQAQQLENLVKIYETMKPDDAAKIFETLDMPTLLEVVLRMKPKSTAPIMAKMAPEKAKELTVALTKQDQLPQIK
jgi:flagellar motility protein MotE (MotC chaperone)